MLCCVMLCCVGWPVCWDQAELEQARLAVTVAAAAAVAATAATQEQLAASSVRVSVDGHGYYLVVDAFKKFVGLA